MGRKRNRSLDTRRLLAVLVSISAFQSCSNTPANPRTGNSGSTDAHGASANSFADVIQASVSGMAGAYTFSVTIQSPDTGCQRYADWWEIISDDGVLLYRRLLAHSHVGEQPFTRTGGPVNAGEDTLVIVRAHMNPAGFGGRAVSGTPATGLTPRELPPDFAADLEDAKPQPDSCAF